MSNIPRHRYLCDRVVTRKDQQSSWGLHGGIFSRVHYDGDRKLVLSY